MIEPYIEGVDSTKAHLTIFKKGVYVIAEILQEDHFPFLNIFTASDYVAMQANFDDVVSMLNASYPNRFIEFEYASKGGLLEKINAAKVTRVAFAKDRIDSFIQSELNENTQIISGDHRVKVIGSYEQVKEKIFTALKGA